MQRLLSQVRHVELLRLYLKNSRGSAARVIPLFGSVASIHHLRLCFPPDFYCCNTLMLSASAKQLDLTLASSEGSANSFRTLRIVQFAWYFTDDSEEALRVQCAKISAWVQNMLPRLHERCAVEVYIYKCSAFL